MLLYAVILFYDVSVVKVALFVFVLLLSSL